MGVFLGEIHSVERMTRDQLPESLSSIVGNKFSFFSDDRDCDISLHAKEKLTMERTTMVCISDRSKSNQTHLFKTLE